MSDDSASCPSVPTASLVYTDFKYPELLTLEGWAPGEYISPPLPLVLLTSSYLSLSLWFWTQYLYLYV